LHDVLHRLARHLPAVDLQHVSAATTDATDVVVPERADPSR
jgi:hypothetical protein